MPSFSPYVPDLIVIRDEQGRNHVHGRNGRLKVTLESVSAQRRVCPCTPEPVREGRWPIVHVLDPGGTSPRTELVEWLPAAEEADWRSKRAQALLRESGKMKGLPEEALSSIRAAAALAAVDLQRVVRDLESLAGPGESLSSVYERTRGR